MRWLISLLSVAVSLHAAGPVRTAWDAQVVAWNERCMTNNPNKLIPGPAQALNHTITLVASSQWMGAVRSAGLYPGNILRANLMCGGSYDDVNGTGACTSVGCYNIGSPQVPLINDVGGSMDVCLNGGGVNSLQGYWQYSETGSSGGLGAVNVTNHAVVFDTGVAPSAVSSWLNDLHAGMYVMGRGVEAGGPLGVYNGVSSFVQITASFSGVGQSTAIGDPTGRPANADTNGAGFYLGTRTSNAAGGIQQYKNGVATGTSSATGGDVNINIDIWVFGRNLNGTADPIGCPMGGYTLGRGLTSGQQLAYYNAWQQFETLLGRQK